MNENEITEKRRKTDAELTKANDKAYAQVKKREQEVVKFKTGNDWKEKIVERVTYRNGVIKSRLVGLMKNGKLIYGAKAKK